MDKGVPDSEYYMWRTLFAVAHADNKVTDEEVRFMAAALADVPFSEEQREQLQKDASNAQDIEEMFIKITDVKDQAAFFKFAHELVHIDGDYGAEEQEVMLRLKELHVQHADVDSLVGSVSLSLDDGSPDASGENVFDSGVAPKTFTQRVYSFRDAFVKKLKEDDD